MSLFETTNRNFIVSLTIVICTALMVPIFSYGLSWGLLIQISQYLGIWAIITIIPAIIFHFAKLRSEFRMKEFAVYTGFCLLPILIRNIVHNLLNNSLSAHLDGIFDISTIIAAENNLLLQLGIFFYVAIPIIALCLFIILLGISMKRVYDVGIEKALLISIPIVFFAFFVASQIGGYMGLLF